MRTKKSLLMLTFVVTAGCSDKKPADSRSLLVWDKPVFTTYRLPITKSTTCGFKKSFAVSFAKHIRNEELNPPPRIYYDVSDEDESDTVSFLDLDTKSPKVQSNGGQASLSIIRDDGEMLQMINAPFPAGVELYTILRESGVIIHSKQDRVLGVAEPLGTLEMGYCN